MYTTVKKEGKQKRSSTERDVTSTDSDVPYPSFLAIKIMSFLKYNRNDVRKSTKKIKKEKIKKKKGKAGRKVK